MIFNLPPFIVGGVARLQSSASRRLRVNGGSHARNVIRWKGRRVMKKSRPRDLRQAFPSLPKVKAQDMVRFDWGQEIQLKISKIGDQNI